MIKIDYTKENRNFEFRSKGHANYDELGKDIVCSAVSSIIIGALNAIKDIDSFEIKIKEGDVTVKSIKPVSDYDNVVLDTMLIQLQTVESQFKKNLMINKEK